MAARLRIVIRSKDADRLREILRDEDLDINCGGPKQTHGEWVVEAYAPQEVATRLRKAGLTVEVDRDFEKRAVARRAEVGHGNRYQNRRTVPRGIGKKE